jgi:hypothetical protein
MPAAGLAAGCGVHGWRWGACLATRWLSRLGLGWRLVGQLFRSQGKGRRCACCVSAGYGGDEVGEYERAEADVDE